MVETGYSFSILKTKRSFISMHQFQKYYNQHPTAGTV